MSKKHRRKDRQSSVDYPVSSPVLEAASDGLQAEYRVIKFDLVKVAILNAVFLTAVLTLYYTNLHSQYLERWFEKILHF